LSTLSLKRDASMVFGDKKGVREKRLAPTRRKTRYIGYKREKHREKEKRANKYLLGFEEDKSPPNKWSKKSKKKEERGRRREKGVTKVAVGKGHKKAHGSECETRGK